MTSQTQLEANRTNSKRSTGPRTVAGKAQSRKNAVKHGLTAKCIVLGDEDPEEFEALRANLQMEFEPSSRLRRELIDHLAGLLWRRRRVHALEAALVKAREAELRAELEKERESERFEAIHAEACRRCDELFGDDPDAIFEAKMDRTYFARLDDFIKEVEAKQASTTKDEDAVKSCPDLESGLLTLIIDVENGEVLAKLSRYEASLTNAIHRTLQHILLLETKRSTKLISG
jgi:hypothetical protein